jgi:hypothetical protein
LTATINVVAQEEVVGAWWIFAVVKEAEEILELTVDVPTYCDWRLKFEEDRLIEIDLADFLAEPHNLDAWQARRRTERCVFEAKELLNNLLQGHRRK